MNWAEASCTDGVSVLSIVSTTTVSGSVEECVVDVCPDVHALSTNIERIDTRKILYIFVLVKNVAALYVRLDLLEVIIVT